MSSNTKPFRKVVFLLIFLEPVQTKSPSLDWKPTISVVQDGGSLVVTVQPMVPIIDNLKICVSLTSSIPCVGKESVMESPSNIKRYRVEGLATNQSYYVYVRPYDKDDMALDIWIHKKDPVFLKPWEPETVQPPKEKSVTLQVVVISMVIMLLLLLACVVSGFVCWRRGYLQQLGPCSSQHAFHGPPIKVLPVYQDEKKIFVHLVKTHLEYLKEYVQLECMKWEDLMQQPNIGQWQEQTHRVLVYLSPELTRQLLWAQAEGSTAVSCQVEHICRLASAWADCSRRRQRPAPVIFIIPDFWFPDLYTQLAQSPVFRGLPHFSIPCNPRPLVRQLGGSFGGWLTICLCHRDSQHRDDLARCISTLQSMMNRDQYQNAHLAGDEELRVERNGHPCMGSTHCRLGHPHRTDSGFSSSAPDHHHGGSNSSCEHTSHGSERDVEEEGKETDPMIQGTGRNISVSQMSVFLPPESVAGDDDSVVIQDNLRTVNRRGDWSS